MTHVLSYKPTVPSEVKQAVPLMYSSGPESFDYVFCQQHQKQALSYLEHAFVEHQTEFSHRNQMGLYLGQELVGIGTIKTGDASFKLLLAAAKSIFAFYPIYAAFGVIWRGLKIETIIVPPGKGVAMLSYLGINPNNRGQGLGTQLVYRLEQHAVDLGYHKVILDVADNNPKAKALYLRLGYVEKHRTASKLRSRFGFVPGSTRMQKTLNIDC